MALTRYTLRQFEAFLAVADLRGFNAAADRLGLSASAVSQLVAELESLLGFRLFERTTRRVELSGAGRDYLPSAKSLLRHLRQAETDAEAVRNRAVGIVKVGAPLVLAGTLLPAAIKDYLGKEPRVVVRIVDTAVDMLVDRVRDGDADLAIGPDRSTGEAVRREPLFDSPWVLWCAPDHPLVAHSQLCWSQLRDVALVSTGRDHELSVARMHAQTPEDLRVTPMDIVDNMSTALALAKLGLAATMAPFYAAIMAEPMGLVHRHVVDPETVRQVCLYRPATRQLSPAAGAFGEFLSKWLRDWHATPAKSGQTTQ